MVSINPADFITEMIPAEGQKTIGLIHKLHSGVRLTHKPTGTTTESTSERSPHANRAIAWERMEAELKAAPAAVAVGEREAFEKWAGIDYPIHRGFGRLNDYGFMETRRMWEAWQARAALATTPEVAVRCGWVKTGGDQNAPALLWPQQTPSQHPGATYAPVRFIDQGEPEVQTEPVGYFVSGPNASCFEANYPDIESSVRHLAMSTGDDPDDYTATPLYARPSPQATQQDVGGSPKCAQCKKPYRKNQASVGCPKCAPGAHISEVEFQKPLATQQDAIDAGWYRFIVENNLILCGGTEQFGWPIAPFGTKCHRYIDAVMKSGADK